jgi:hypothetical protein
MITMTIDIASVFLGVCIGCLFTLFISWVVN